MKQGGADFFGARAVRGHGRARGAIDGACASEASVRKDVGRARRGTRAWARRGVRLRGPLPNDKNLSCQLMSWENLKATARLPRPSRLAWCMLRKSGTGESVVKGGTAYLGLALKFGFSSRSNQWTSWRGWGFLQAS